MDWTNQLYYGDNLRVLREEIADESVDLVYLDPRSTRDGLIRFLEREGEPARTIIVQVKSGKVSSRDIRDLVGTLDREKAVIGIFITLQPPTRDMDKEAVSAGFYQSQWGGFPRLQILTIADLLDGTATALYPRMNAATFKRATRQRRTQGEQGGLF
jgi:site-specific DNA-methyltransferase (adenine-specific)